MAAKVNLLTGPVCSGKTTILMQNYRQATQNGVRGPACARNLWIGPDRHSVAKVRDSLLVSAEEAYLGIEILTFASYAESVVAAGKKQIRPISQLQKRRLLQFAVANAIESSQITHYTQVANTPGFLAQASELIAELKRRDIWPEQLAKRCQEQREHELATIFDRYQQSLLDYELYDAEGRFWAARRLLSEQSTSTHHVEYSLVVVDGFTDFTSAQYDILHHLAQHSTEMQISLSLDNPNSHSADPTSGRSLLFAKATQTLSRLRQIFPNIQINFRDCSHFNSPGLRLNSPGLRHIAEHLFSDPHETNSAAADSSGIEILAASSVQQEIDEVAQRIKHLLGSGQARPHEIALVYRSLEEMSPRIRETLADHGIPFALESQTRLIASPLLRGIFSLLRLHAEDWPFRQLLEVVSNRLLQVPQAASTEGESGSIDSRASIEHCIRSAQLPSGRKPLFDQLQRWIDAKESGSSKYHQLATQAEVSLQHLQNLAEVLNCLPQQAPLSQWVEQLRILLARLSTLPDEQSQDELQSSRHRITKPAWVVLQRGLRAIESLDSQINSGTSMLSITDFLDLLEMVARDQRLSTAYDSTGRVNVLSSESARHISVKYLFLAGLGEQSFASLADGNPLFDVRRFEQQTLSQNTSVEIAPEQLNAEALQLFYELATRATHQLTLSYPAMDVKGQPLSPSPLLVELKRCFGDTTVAEHKSSLGELLQTDTEPQSEAAFRQQAIARALEGDRHWLAGLLSEANRAPAAEAITNGIHCIAQRGNREQFGSYDGLITGEVAQKMLAQRFDSAHHWSASQLENYAACPFRFFGEQLLSLEPPEQLALRSDVRRRGSLLHQVLATLHQHAGDSGQDLTTAEQSTSDLVERFCHALQKAIDGAPLFGLQQALREIERREIEALAPQYAQQEVDYRSQWQHLDQPPEPRLFEVRFGPSRHGGGGSEESDPTALPFELDLGDEKILLTGQIDRVDVGQVAGVTVFNIIDYKSGKQVKLQIDKVRSGEQLQLPLYAMAAEKLLLADQNALALATGYWSVAGKGFQSGRSGALEVRQIEGRELKISQQWEELQPELLDRVGQIVHGIRDGQFPVYNSDQNCTRYCNLATICRIAHIRSLEKHWEPPSSQEQETQPE